MKKVTGSKARNNNTLYKAYPIIKPIIKLSPTFTNEVEATIRYPQQHT